MIKPTLPAELGWADIVCKGRGEVFRDGYHIWMVPIR
jgi:hypothetical protein